MGSRVAKVLIMVVVLVAVTAVAVGAQNTNVSVSDEGISISINSAAGAASAISKQCYSVPCHGSANHETIYERIGDGQRDVIYGYGNNDNLHANTYSQDTDRAYGLGGGTDHIFVNDGDTLDGAHGGAGNDYCYVDATIEAADTCENVVVR